MDREAWWATVHGVEKSRTQLSLSLSLSHTHTHTHTYMLNPDVLLLHTTLPTSLTPNPKFIYVTGTQ